MSGARRSVLPAAFAGLVLVSAAALRPADLKSVRANDNRVPAGTLRNGVLTLHLEVRTGVWHPEAEPGDSVIAPVFAEEGKGPQVPGPLIRVPTGTTIDLTLRNALPDSTLTLHGFHTRPAATGDSVVLKPGESRSLRFPAGQPGTYFYWAVAGIHDTLSEREQLAGGFVIDSAGLRPADRVFVINIWGSLKDSVTYGNALAINGRSWPHSERIIAPVGDTLHWRWINASLRPHPMHLHGFYFRLDALGNDRRDSAFAPASRPLLVTRDMAPGSTMAITWAADRPGNWLFHCHIGFHVVPDATLSPPPPSSHNRMAHDPTVHMAGLVLGITAIPPRHWAPPTRDNPRALRLLIQEGTRRFRAPRSLGFVLQREAAPPAADSIEIPGSLLVLSRNQPTDITVVNRLKEPASIHWHGIELESYSDGVPGWSGAGVRTAPSIEPGDSFTAHLTLPRAGTFIYHTHMNDIEQITSGLYGAIVVLPPGQTFDRATDHVYVAGWDGADGAVQILVNGDTVLAPLSIAADMPHRFRFVGIGAASGARFVIRQDTTIVSWRAVARDGADLPIGQAIERRANQYVGVGETFDFELRPLPGVYTMSVGPLRKPFMVQRITVGKGNAP